LVKAGNRITLTGVAIKAIQVADLATRNLFAIGSQVLKVAKRAINAIIIILKSYKASGPMEAAVLCQLQILDLVRAAFKDLLAVSTEVARENFANLVSPARKETLAGSSTQIKKK
jgi:hypothetical protein